jgi:hypothetical protein
MIWERSGDSFSATVETSSGDVRFYVTVERLSPQSWDWTAWQPGQPPRLAHYGTAPTAQLAMSAAEEAAK